MCAIVVILALAGAPVAFSAPADSTTPDVSAGTTGDSASSGEDGSDENDGNNFGEHRVGEDDVVPSGSGVVDSLSLSSPAGTAGETLTVSLTTDCRPDATLRWDGESVDVDAAEWSESGVTWTMTVPPQATLGGHRVAAHCGTRFLDGQTFTVSAPRVANPERLPPPPPPPPAPPPPPSSTTTAPTTTPPTTTSSAEAAPPESRNWFGPLMMAAVALIAAAVAGGTVVRLRRPRRAERSAQPVVEARPRWAMPTIGVQDRPEPGDMHVVVRVESHWDTGIQTIQEVDDDHIRID